jgi:hypothetical protein
MSERRTPYTVTQSEQQPRLVLPEPVNLGQHMLEVLEDQTVLLVKRTQWNAMVQLDRDEAYRLMVTLQSMFESDDHLSSTREDGQKP